MRIHFLKYSVFFLWIINLMCVCNPAMTNSSSYQQNGVTKQDTTVIIHSTYKITLPKSYQLTQSQGDDSNIFNAVSENQKLKLSYEVGPGAKVKSVDHFLTNSKVTVCTIKRLNTYKLILAYDRSGGSFRSINGVVYIQQSNKKKLLLNVSLNEDLLPELKMILKSITTIN